MRVGGVGLRKGHAYLGYSSFKKSGALSSTKFKYKSEDYEVYALGFSDAAQTLGISVNRPLEFAFTLHIGQDEIALFDATTTESQFVRLHEWEASGLGWSEDEEVAVHLVSAEMSRPNVVLIFADDLGWGDIQANNPDSAMTTPLMDGIAAGGANLTDAHSPSAVNSK